MIVPLCVPDITEADVQRVAEVLRSGWLTDGPYNEQLEAEFARYMGVKHAISLNSCTSALHLSVLGLGITGEVITPSFTWASTANAIVTAGAHPVFVDIDYTTCNVDPAAVAAAVTPNTEGIMVVHYAGQVCDMEAILAIAARYGLAVIEDSAETIGGERHGKKGGTFGSTGCYSFYATKNMATGEGGMVVTDDTALAQRMTTLASHGIPTSTFERERSPRPWLRAATLPGYNFRMTNYQAALGVGQLHRLDEMNTRRRQIAAWYNEHLRRFDELDLPVEVEGNKHVYQMYTVKVRGLNRDDFLIALRERGVLASAHFDPPVHRQPYYVGRFGDTLPTLPVTDLVASTIVTLPLFPGMTEAQCEHVVRSIEEVLIEIRRRLITM